MAMTDEDPTLASEESDEQEVEEASTSPSPSGREPWLGAVQVPLLVLRSGPSTRAAQIGVLVEATPVQVLDRSDGWLHVLADGQEGYVYGEWVRWTEDLDAEASTRGLEPASRPAVRAVRAADLPPHYAKFIYGLHEAGGEHLMTQAGRPGWVVELAAVGLDGGNQPADFRRLSEQGLGVIVRINHGYGSTGTLPTPDKYEPFARACAAYVQRSRGCHLWIVGNEPNHEQERPNGQQITPQDYVRAYRRCRQAIRALPGHEQDEVLVAGPAPWNNRTQYAGNENGDWAQYFADTLALLEAGECDGFAIHTYTRDHNPARISADVAFAHPEFNHLRDEFRTYRDFMERIPGRFRHLPVFITETDPTDPNIGWEPAENRGWVQAAYREIAEWNSQPQHQPIQALCLYRWPEADAAQEQWIISKRPGIIEDFRQALRAEPAGRDRVRLSAVPAGPVVAIPRIYTNQHVINAFYFAAQSLGRDDWSLLEKAGLDVFQLAEDRPGLYRGEAVERLPNLTQAERSMVQDNLVDQLAEQVRWEGVINAPAGLNLRKGPGSQHEVITTLPDKTVIKVLDDREDWLFVVVEGQSGYVYREYVQRRTGPAASRIRRTWDRYRERLVALADRLGIDPAVAVAVLVAESGGEATGPGGRMTIRFENHIFYNEWGQRDPDRFYQHFDFDENQKWRGHRWRPDPDGEWQPCHVNQAGEWQVFEFARGLAEEAAMRSISMGAPQIMGFNHGVLGYSSAREMFEAFQGSEEHQIEGLFRFIEGKNLVEPLRRGDFLAFASGYNGPGQAETYRNIIQRNLDEFNQSVRRTMEVPAVVRGLEPSFAADGAPEAQTRMPLPLGPDQTGGKPLYEVDPDLYASWRQHIQQGFNNNNEMFNRILNGFMNPYYTTIWMYRVMFAVGIIAVLAAVALAYLLRDNPTAALGTAGIFAGLSAVTFLTYFLGRPLQALEENLQFITWLGIVYNTYWTRLAYTMDQKTFHQDIEAATNDAIHEIERLIEKHAAMRSKRPNLQ